jgi:AhpD family alkylhydroperoxidase
MKLQKSYKRTFRFQELYSSFVFVPRALVALLENRIHPQISRPFIERLMLAVTEVNGCPACSWAHTRMALREGISQEEIRSFLNGENRFVSDEESKAILFAQHFADTRGYPAKDAYEALVAEYGPEKACVILSAIQVILAGNIVGIPTSALFSRIKGNPYTDSSLFYELLMHLAMLIFLPVACVHALLRWLLGRPNHRLATL